jgi:hypothetical protein
LTRGDEGIGGGSGGFIRISSLEGMHSGEGLRGMHSESAWGLVSAGSSAQPLAKPSPAGRHARDFEMQ